MASIALNSVVKLGVVPTHLKFVGGLVPDDEGRIPRSDDGKLTTITNVERLLTTSDVAVDIIQLPFFPGLNEDDIKELVEGIRALGVEANLVLMVGGADPMNPADEDAVVDMLVSGLRTAKALNVEHVSSTSIEEWMEPGATRKEGSDFDAAVAQTAAVHTRAYEEAGVEGSSIVAWHIEFLRGGEFQTFTDLGRAWEMIKATNAKLGKPFFKLLVDAAHCGDSTLTIPENEALIAQIAASDELGIFHASAPTTRGCLSTDDGWVGALLTAAAKTGKLDYVFVEVFHHEDAALEGLRNLDPGHGIDTRDGRSYDELVIDNLRDVARRLNNLVTRGILRAR